MVGISVWIRNNKTIIQKWSIQVLRDALSSIVLAPLSAQLHHIQARSLKLSEYSVSKDESDPIIGITQRALSGTPPDDPTQRELITRLLPLFRFPGGRLWYENKICVPHRNIRHIHNGTHDRRICGNFSSPKTISRLNDLHGLHNSCGLRSYYPGSLTGNNKRTVAVYHWVFLNLFSLRIRGGDLSRWIRSPTYVAHPVVTMPYPPLSIYTFVVRFSRRVHIGPWKQAIISRISQMTSFEKCSAIMGSQILLCPTAIHVSIQDFRNDKIIFLAFK